MVDIYDIIPASNDKATIAVLQPGTYAFPGQDPTAARFQTLLAKLSSHEDLASAARIDWGTPDDDHFEMQQGAPPIRVAGGEPLLGNFADAAAAMR